MNKLDFPINLYCRKAPLKVKTIDLCRKKTDFRKVYIVEEESRKIVIKHSSNAFTDEQAVKGWFRLIQAYNSVGIYCPSAVKNLNGDIVFTYEEDGRKFCVYAEEFAIYKTAEETGRKKIKNKDGSDIYTPDLFRSLGRVAAAIPELLLFLLVSVISSVYFSYDLENINQKTLALLPKRIGAWLVRFKDGFLKTAVRYLRSYLILGLITFAIMTSFII